MFKDFESADKAAIVKEVARWNTKPADFKRYAAHKLASDAAARDTSDPFTYGRIHAHVMSGVITPTDFGVSDWNRL